MFAYTDDGQWNSEKKCHDRNKPDTWQVKCCVEINQRVWCSR